MNPLLQCLGRTPKAGQFCCVHLEVKKGSPCHPPRKEGLFEEMLKKNYDGLHNRLNKAGYFIGEGCIILTFPWCESCFFGAVSPKVGSYPTLSSSATELAGPSFRGSVFGDG